MVMVYSNNITARNWCI